MREKGHLFLTEEFHLINVQGIRKLQNHHQANTAVIVASKMGAKISGQKLEDICIVSTSLPQDVD